MLRLYKAGYIVNLCMQNTHQLYLLEQHSETFKIWSAITRIYTEGNSLIMKLDPDIYISRYQQDIAVLD